MFLMFRHYKNVYRAITTDAGKEVTRSKKVKDKNFLMPKSITEKTLNKTKTFGGQVPQLLKSIELGTKCGKQKVPNARKSDSDHTNWIKCKSGFRKRQGFRG